MSAATKPFPFQCAIDYPSYLSRHDLLWTVRPLQWANSAFLGNGMLGATIYSDEHRSKRNVYRYVMGRVDVTAKRPSAFAARVPIGEFEVEFGSWILDSTSMRLDLWNAELTAHPITVQGSGKVTSFIHSLEDVLVVEVETTQTESAAFRWYPWDRVSQALKVNDGQNIDQYFPETTLTETVLDGVSLQCQQYNHCEDGCTAGWICRQIDSCRFLYYAAILQGHSQTVKQQTANLLNRAASVPLEEYRETHRQWWHTYYQKSFVSFGDTRLESFYWIQLYKLACATREDKLIMDNQGPWTAHTPWPGTWFNMNVQLAYAPVCTSNHLEIGASLCNRLDQQLPTLIQNVPEPLQKECAALARSMSHDLAGKVGEEIGNLVWVCHNYYRQLRCSLDLVRLREKFYPLLRRAVNYYLAHLTEGEDGKLHLPKSISPEYGSFWKLTVEDCNYDLFLLRWGLDTLQKICRRLGIEDEQASRWQFIQENLADYPVDETGFLIGKDVPLTLGHRHYSHLLGVSPLHIVDCDDPENQKLIHTTLRHWLGLEGDLRGFTFAGAGSIAAALGRGDEALAYIQSALELFSSNTFYREAGPVIESPLGVMEAINDLLLQSWGEEIRVFPALPSSWKDVVFHHLLAEGAFLVSAEQKGGSLTFIRIESQAGEPCRLKCSFQGEIQAVYSDGRREFLLPDKDVYSIPLKKGESVLLFQGEPDAAVIRPVQPSQPILCNYYGSFKPWRTFGIPFSD